MFNAYTWHNHHPGHRSGVGFRPFVYAKAREFGITGTVKISRSEVEIHAFGDRFEEFLEAVSGERRYLT
ncbi:acylphosphatase [Methanoculleus sp. 10]|uniref:acylphosphatase n=1 Tax=Methanoculleus sp. 10 TaxID=430615 RepID=UPI00343C27BC